MEFIFELFAQTYDADATNAELSELKNISTKAVADGQADIHPLEGVKNIFELTNFR